MAASWTTRGSSVTFLRLLTWPYVRKHKLRTLLTLAGIMLGVAVFVGMHGANRTVAGAFQKTVDRIAGKAQLQVSAGETGFPEEVLEKVQSLREVAAAAPVIEAVLTTNIKGQGNLLVLGVDMTGDRSLREYDLEGGAEDEVIEDPLVFLAQPDSLILSRKFAEANGIVRNQKITLDTMNGPRQFTVRGLMKADGLAGAFGGNIAVMDIYAAQFVFGRGRLFDRIDIGLAEGVDLLACQQKLRDLLGPGFDVQPPASRTQQFEAIARGLSTSINLTSLFALLIGVFIIYNSFSIAITQRRSEIGILRALGASQSQVLGMFLAESAVAGFIGSLLGVGLGLLMARAVTPFMSFLVREIYGTHQAPEGVEMSPLLLGGAVALGTLVSLVGGWLPARSAAAVDPVKALQKGRYQVLGAGENRARRILALVFACLSALSLIGSRDSRIFYAGYAIMVLALVLLTPSLSHRLAKLLRPVLRLIRPVEGTLAADSLIDAPRRTSATVSALMLSLALAVGFAGVSRGIYRQIQDWVDDTLNPDLFIAPTESVTQRSFRFPGSLVDEIAAVEGVDEVQAVRTARVQLKGTPTMAIALDVTQVAGRIKYKPLDADPEEMTRRASAGEGAIIATSLAAIRGLKKGDIMEIAAPDGLLKLPVLASRVDFSDQQGAFVIDRKLYMKHWRDDTVNVMRVYVKKGHDAEQVRTRILERFGSHRKLFVYTNSAIRELIMKTTGQWFGMTYLQLMVSLLVAIMGIVNTMTVSITDRRRELGILQAVGGLRQQIRNTVWLEAVAIGVIGVILGCLMGAVTLYYNLEMVAGDMAGLRLDYLYPFSFAAALLPVIVGAAFLAAIWPAEAAVRASLVESLEYE